MKNSTTKNETRNHDDEQKRSNELTKKEIFRLKIL